MTFNKESQNGSFKAWETMDAELQQERQIVEMEEERKELTVRLQTLQQQSTMLQRKLQHLDANKKELQNNVAERKTARWEWLGTEANCIGIATSILSGLICGLIMFSFCVAFASLIFEKDLEDHISLGVEIQCATVFIGAIGKFTTGMPFSIFGPDIIPALFLASAAKKIQEVLSGDTDNGEISNQLIPTLLVSFMLSSFLLSISCGLLVYFKGHRAVNYLPISVLKGFLACIGYEVMKAAWKTSAGAYYQDLHTWNCWKLVLPAFPMGLAMYFFKRYHIGNPVVTMGSFLVGPLVLFFIILAASGTSIEEARDAGWFYGKADYILFEKQWELADMTKVSGAGLGAAIIDVLVLVLVCSMDILLKLQSSKKALRTEVDMVHELKVAGLMNAVSGGAFGVPVYSQVKFNILNFGITHNKFDKLPGFIVAAFAGLVWLSGYPIVNFIPRFFLGGLLVYAGMAFVVTNIIESYWRLTKKEYLVVIAMVAIIASLDQLVYAVLIGVVLAALIFAVQYGRINVVSGTFTGAEYASTTRRRVVEAKVLQKLGRRLFVVRLQHFIFFGTANQILEIVREALAESKNFERVEQFRYLIFDFKMVYNIDWTGVSILVDIIQLLKESRVRVILCEVCDRVRSKLEREDVVESVILFGSFDSAAEYVESMLLRRAMTLRNRWFTVDSFKMLHRKAVVRKESELFEALKGKKARRMWRYVTTRKVSKTDPIYTSGVQDETLYFLVKGKACIYLPKKSEEIMRGETKSLAQPITATVSINPVSGLNNYLFGNQEPKASPRSCARMRRKVLTVRAGTFFNEQALFSDTAPTPYEVIAKENCSLYCITRPALDSMRSNDPLLLAELFQIVLQQSAYRTRQMEKQRYAVSHFQGQVRMLEEQNLEWRGGSVTKVVSLLREHSKKPTLKKSHTKRPADTSTLARNRMRGKTEIVKSKKREIKIEDSSHSYQVSSSYQKRGFLADEKYFRHYRRSLETITPKEKKVKQLQFSLHLSSHFRRESRSSLRKTLRLISAPASAASAYSSVSPGTASIELVEWKMKIVKKVAMHMGIVPSPADEVIIRRLLETKFADCSKDSKSEETPSIPEKSPALSRDTTRDSAFGLEMKLMPWEHMEKILKLLVFADLKPREIMALKTAFTSFTEDDGSGLSKEGLGKLMVHLNSPADEVELSTLIDEWGDKKSHKIGFETFLSMCAAIAKREELIERVERDFLIFAKNSGAYERDSKTSPNLDDQKEPIIITVEGIVKTFSDRGNPIPDFIAAEMLYDADFLGRGYLTIDEFVAYLSTIPDLNYDGQTRRIKWREVVDEKQDPFRRSLSSVRVITDVGDL